MREQLLQDPVHADKQVISHEPLQLLLQLPVHDVLQPPEQLLEQLLQPVEVELPLHELLQLEHPVDLEVPVQFVEHPEEQSDAQDEHPDEDDDVLQLVEQPEQLDDVELFAQEFWQSVTGWSISSPQLLNILPIEPVKATKPKNGTAFDASALKNSLRV